VQSERVTKQGYLMSLDDDWQSLKKKWDFAAVAQHVSYLWPSTSTHMLSHSLGQESPWRLEETGMLWSVESSEYFWHFLVVAISATSRVWLLWCGDGGRHTLLICLSTVKHVMTVAVMCAAIEVSVCRWSQIQGRDSRTTVTGNELDQLESAFVVEQMPARGLQSWWGWAATCQTAFTVTRRWCRLTDAAEVCQLQMDGTTDRFVCHLRMSVGEVDVITRAAAVRERCTARTGLVRGPSPVALHTVQFVCMYVAW